MLVWIVSEDNSHSVFRNLALTDHNLDTIRRLSAFAAVVLMRVGGSHGIVYKVSLLCHVLCYNCYTSWPIYCTRSRWVYQDQRVATLIDATTPGGG